MGNLVLELRCIHVEKASEHEMKTGRKIEHTSWSRAADEIERLISECNQLKTLLEVEQMKLRLLDKAREKL